MERDDNLDIEVACSGFTKQMEKDLLQEYGMESASDDDGSDNDDQESDAETENNEEELDRLRQQVNAEVKFSEERANERDSSKSISFNIKNYMSSLSKQPENGETEVFEDALEDLSKEIPLPSPTIQTEQPQTEETIKSLASVQISDSNSVDGNVSSGGEDDDELGDLDPKSREYRFKMVEKILSDARSHRSYSTSASTIAPSVVSDRIKKTLNVKEKREQRKRCVAKGEASATTRVRNENRDTCKEYAGWDF